MLLIVLHTGDFPLLLLHYYFRLLNEQIGSSGKVSDMYSGGASFESWPGHRRSDWGSSSQSSSPPDKFWSSTSYLVTSVFCHILLNMSLINPSLIWAIQYSMSHGLPLLNAPQIQICFLLFLQYFYLQFCELGARKRKEGKFCLSVQQCL
jgi:hypothetical protein